MLHTYAAAMEGFNYNDTATVFMPAVASEEQQVEVEVVGSELYETESSSSQSNVVSKQLSPNAVEFTPSNQVAV